jgi:hypothetical protein
VLTIDYGKGPQDDELEVVVFGPGYGESIAVHLGSRRWLLVDSCIAPGTSSPASEVYLSSIGVGTDCVKAIVASHWHDDHVRGMSKLVAKYPAPLFFPAVFQTKEGAAFLAAYSGADCPGLSAGTKELYNSLSARQQSVAVKKRTEILEGPLADGRVRVLAFSPTDAAFAQFLARILPYDPRITSSMPIGHAPEISPNLSSIVLHIDLGVDALLLGADLERHSAGWDDLVVDPWCLSKSRAGYIKIAHHGSVTGDHPKVWEKFLKPDPVGVMTPFQKGRHSLPTKDDRQRISGTTPFAYISSAGSRRPQLQADQLKRLNDICAAVAPANLSFGAVRARRRLSKSTWDIELFGSAAHLGKVA